MNKLELKGNWNVAKGKLKQKWAKLTDDSVRAIRTMRFADGATYASIAARFGVSEGTVYSVIIGRRWKHVV